MECPQLNAKALPSSVTCEASARISTMSLLCALLVILIHADRAPIAGTLSSILFQIGFILTRVAVPFFFCAAAYFLAGRTHEPSWYMREVKKRVRSLLVPMWVGSIFTFLWSTVLIIGANYYHSEPLCRNLPQTVVDWATILALNPFDNPLTPFWFLRTLFVFVLASPLLVWIVQRSKYAAITLVIVTYGLYSVFTYCVKLGLVPDESCLKELLTWLFSLKDLFFFTVGIVVRYYPIRLPTGTASNLFFVMMALLLAVLSWYFSVETFIVLPMLTLFVYLAMPIQALPTALTTCSFPIYVLHMIPLGLINCIFKNVPSLSFSRTSVLGWLIIGVSTMIICMIMCHIMRKVLPKFSCLLFGGR